MHPDVSSQRRSECHYRHPRQYKETRTYDMSKFHCIAASPLSTIASSPLPLAMMLSLSGFEGSLRLVRGGPRPIKFGGRGRGDRPRSPHSPNSTDAMTTRRIVWLETMARNLRMA